MFKRLLAPLDGSRLAEAVLPIAERLGQAGATIVLLHVIERGAPMAVHGERHLSSTVEATTYLEGVAARLRAGGVTVECHTHDVPEGDVARSITSHAAEERADLIVLCTHGSGRVHNMLFGTIAQHVLQQGATPVLLARPLRAGEESGPFAPRRVLVALDATVAAEAALAAAQSIARALGSTLHLVMVVATQRTVRGDRLAAATLLPGASRAALDLEEQQAADYLEGWAERLRGPELAVTTEVRRGDTAAALADEASEPGVGLVVAATHGRAGVQAIWTGSVVAQLLSRTRAPMLLLRIIEGP